MQRQEEPKGCLIAILKLFGVLPSGDTDKGDGADELPYRRKDYLLSKAERAFFETLQKAVGNRCLIFAKVRLADLLFIRRGTERRQSYFNRIRSKHIDFVLCDRDAVRPLLAIELDDSSHNRPDRKQRDTFVDSALAAAELPILHVKARADYDGEELARAIEEKIKAQRKDAK